MGDFGAGDWEFESRVESSDEIFGTGVDWRKELCPSHIGKSSHL
jgi:hypothetical protein